MPEETNALPTGYSLHRYQIDGVLGAGGFGITYRAIHEALENQVAIKEYFPAEWAYRDHNGTTVRANSQGQIPARSGEPPCYDWGLQRFLDEAKILVQINHPGVVRVRDYFTANGSAYIVMEYEEGESLSAALQRGGILPEHELRRLLKDVMPALEAVHGEGYLHRDIKPSNLYIRSHDGHIILIDFGAARQALGRRTRSVTSVVTPGYSPIEQYVTVGEDYGPWTDIYALGAVLYRCITGAPPIEAPGRVLKDPMQPAMEVGAGLYSRGLLQVVDHTLAVRPEDRYQSVVAMREALQAADQSNDFSQIPPIKTSLLDLPSAAPSLLFEPIPPQPSPHQQLPAPQSPRQPSVPAFVRAEGPRGLESPPSPSESPTRSSPTLGFHRTARIASESVR
ncbi:MAG: serine/threonine-protein kinase [Candidatus Competibacteraceae bacterium]|nr:serine/threonine-protein kinase [Candidatus Competibacteraceae bacterium]